MSRILDIKRCKNKRICLVDVDSSIPNLALMKIGGFFRKLGFDIDLVKLNYSAYDHCKRKKSVIDGSIYDKVFVSIIFTINKGLIKVKNCKEVYFGGTGHNYKINLPQEMEHAFPDYRLYKDNEYSMGYLTRGCIRHCPFCFVPKKEGALRFNAPLKEFYNPKLPKVMLLDNNILAYVDCLNILEQLIRTGKKITFKQGMDFRLMTKEKAELLTKLDYDGEYIFAFDRPEDKLVIEKNLEEMWKPLVKDWQTKFYVLVGFNTTLREDLERILFLKENKCLAYVMRHSNCYSSKNRPFYTDLAAWVNQPGLFKNMSFKTFLKKRHTTKERLSETLEIIESNKLEPIHL